MSSSPTDTAIEVVMPQMGVSVAEGTIVEWLRSVGEPIEADEPICEVTTDKIDVEIPAPGSGVVERIEVEAGETVEVGTLLAVIDPSGSSGSTDDSTADGPAAGPAPADTPRAASGDDGSLAPSEQASGEIDRSRFYSPVVRRIAAEYGVDLAEVEGHGVGGRVRKKDLVDYIEHHQQRDRHAPKTLHIESPYRPDDEEEAAPAEPAERESTEAKPAAPAPAAELDELVGPTTREPMDPMRKAIARHMVESRRTSAHCTTVVEADFSAVARRRSELREAMRKRGVSLTYLAFVAQATVATLEEHPVLNASLEGEEIVYHEDVNLGIAVALDAGLVVPVIRKAQRLSLEGMAAEIAEVAARAREGRLTPDDVHGGTFTITNPGQFGAVLATPIINQPQVAILDLEAIVRRPVVIDGPDGESIGIKPMSYLCMSWDHRALDGAVAARFLASLRERIERWEER